MTRIDPKKFRQSLVHPDMQKAVAICLLAQTVSEKTAEHVDSYTKPIFDAMAPSFPISDVARDLNITCVESPDKIYVADLKSPQVEAYFASIEAAHIANGYKVQPGQCPKLVAESLHLAALQSIVELASIMVGTPTAEDLCVLEHGIEHMADLFIQGVLAEDNANVVQKLGQEKIAELRELQKQMRSQ